MKTIIEKWGIGKARFALVGLLYTAAMVYLAINGIVGVVQGNIYVIVLNFSFLVLAIMPALYCYLCAIYEEPDG